MVQRKEIVMQAAEPSITPSRLERILAILAAVICLIVTLAFWFSISAHQSMWLLPGLYFIEMVALSLLGALLFMRGGPHVSLTTWGISGVLFAFSILGALSVGLFYIPVALIFVIISITWDLRNKQPIPVHLGIFLIAAILQSALMLVVIRLLDLGAVL